MTLGEALRQRLEELQQVHGWTQRELARRLGVHPSTVSVVLSGKRRTTVFDQWVTIAALCECSLGELFTDLEGRVRRAEGVEAAIAAAVPVEAPPPAPPALGGLVRRAAISTTEIEAVRRYSQRAGARAAATSEIFTILMDWCRRLDEGTLLLVMVLCGDHVIAWSLSSSLCACCRISLW